MKEMNKKTLLYAFFIITFTIWLALLLVFYFPTRVQTAPIISSVMDGAIRTIFLASTLLSSITSFLIGLDKLGMLSAMRNTIRKYFKF